MRDLTLSEVERLQEQAAEAADAFAMDEESFRAFYDRTATALWAYLSRVTGNRQLADDLMQETYYRFLRAATSYDGEAHRRNYLFRIATNLVRDGYRQARSRPRLVSGAAVENVDRSNDSGAQPERRLHVERAMARLKPRERQMLWLAYAQGSTHKEIAEALGVKCSSIKLLLFRARRKLAGFLRGQTERSDGSDNR